MTKFLLLILGGVLLMSFIIGCNATRGVGTDLKNAGQHIEKIGQ